jgi:hypothetical protein
LSNGELPVNLGPVCMWGFVMMGRLQAFSSDAGAVQSKKPWEPPRLTRLDFLGTAAAAMPCPPADGAYQTNPFLIPPAVITTSTIPRKLAEGVCAST